MIKVSPSLLSADFARLGEELIDIKNAGVDMIHLDVMDGVFVTNISFGLTVIESLRKVSDLVFDVHLMITEPEKYVERFVDAGADIVTFHYEATNNIESTLKKIRAKGAKAAVSVKPNTPVEEIYPYLELCDMVLIMTVEPGYGGQTFITEMLEKIRKLKAEIQNRGLSIDIQVDGGINGSTAKEAKAAGANILVAGNAIFKAKDRKSVIEVLKQD